MRRDGDLLLAHLATAREQVVLCAPFIKVEVMRALLARIRPGIPVKVVTRWLPQEVAAGVSDLEVLDLIAEHPGASLGLIDRLHAKLYVADGAVVGGSANLTATALGWCNRPNLEILMALAPGDPAVVRCLAELETAREATETERDRVRAAAERLTSVPLPEAEAVDTTEIGPWLPRLAAPARLYTAYVPDGRDRLTSATLEAADHDLRALDLPSGKNETAFNRAVAEAFAAMPAMAQILEAAAADLTDEDAVRLLTDIRHGTDMPPETQWLIVREWMTHFLADTYEIAPQTFITRRRPGVGR